MRRRASRKVSPPVVDSSRRGRARTRLCSDASPLPLGHAVHLVAPREGRGGHGVSFTQDSCDETMVCQVSRDALLTTVAPRMLSEPETHLDRWPSPATLATITKPFCGNGRTR